MLSQPNHLLVTFYMPRTVFDTKIPTINKTESEQGLLTCTIKYNSYLQAIDPHSAVARMVTRHLSVSQILLVPSLSKARTSPRAAKVLDF